jgi:hypothetical protein
LLKFIQSLFVFVGIKTLLVSRADRVRFFWLKHKGADLADKR